MDLGDLEDLFAAFGSGGRARRGRGGEGFRARGGDRHFTLTVDFVEAANWRQEAPGAQPR